MRIKFDTIPHTIPKRYKKGGWVMDETQLWNLFLETGDPGVYIMWSKVQQGQDNDGEDDGWSDNQW